MNKKIEVLSTGGTISTEYNEQVGGLVPSLFGKKLLGEAFKSFPYPKLSIEVDDVVRVNSSSLSMEDLLGIRKHVKKYLESDSVDGIVITHGTGMMEATAYFLDISLDIYKPVVMTGAQRDFAKPDSDGPRNLIDAIRVAAHSGSVGQGVLVVFNSEICPARDVTKHHSFAVQAFKSGEHGYLGYVYPNDIIYYRQTIRPEKIKFGQLVCNVDLIKFSIGADARYIDCSIANGARGIVIEASGTGNVNRAFYEGIKQAVKKGILVGITTRTHEGCAIPVYANIGGGVTLVEAGAIMMGDLTGQKARILLMTALGAASTLEEAKQICKQHAM